MALEDKGNQTLPLRFADLKREILPQDEPSKAHFVAAWNDVLAALRTATEEIKSHGSSIISQVEFSELQNLKPKEIEAIKRRGTVLIKNVIDDDQVVLWREELESFVKINPVEGFPEGDKQFFQLHWTKPQIQARAHPNVLQVSTWLNKFFHVNSKEKAQAKILKGVEMSIPLSYADRFRIRHPGTHWNEFPPHIDGGGIERWEEPSFRNCFTDILQGNWQKHDPYDLVERLNARTDIYGRPDQASVFRTFQGWLALSDTGPNEGTLRVFPDVLLSNAYVTLRPFFRLKDNLVKEDPLDPENWVLDVSNPDFPGIFRWGDGFFGPRMSHATHPHLRLDDCMTPIPHVKPGDMVFWHADVVHSVEQEHKGKEDSCVIYIPAMPLTPLNLSYVAKQKEAFLKGLAPPDFPKTAGEGTFVGAGKEGDIVGEVARKAMGLVH
ncbi:DUF1479-domain-containing protein [Fomitiporia mediterranea MF3/22]|uniref:DUF1479-domain-containing protein n=1 Tax=Fomitiporia mediterranea (strain MF3/22) TaxID=694068 RepID=UPI0004407FC0|nr:DUF1479-domain-containing protein [Fomitiporia mediterranea MF3/22]EJD02244.1 DUF1479-domain-containing protein [Fomitiporia mediterranea MF3/22]